MSDVQVHLRGVGSQPWTLPGIPRAGDLVDADGQLWRIVHAVFGQTVSLYAVRAASELASELERWADVPVAEPVEAQNERTLFQ